MNVGEVQAVSRLLINKMLAAGFSAETMEAQAVMCMAEEAGEAVKAARRYMGLARTVGTIEDLRDELADVLIATAGVAHMFGIDLNSAVGRRAEYVLARPVRSGAANP